MVVIGHNIYMFGGQGRTMYEELRMLDTISKQHWNWQVLEEEDAFSVHSG